jgi:hypothetical protein
VGIDRLLGSVAGRALFDQEVVVAGRFDGQIYFRNVQLYQLALLLLVLRDLDEGYVQIGSGTSRGNGWVHAEIRALFIETRSTNGASGKLVGIGGLLPGGDRYDLFEDDELELSQGVHQGGPFGWQHLALSGDPLQQFAHDLVAGPWVSFLNQAKARREVWSA